MHGWRDDEAPGSVLNQARAWDASVPDVPDLSDRRGAAVTLSTPRLRCEDFTKAGLLV